MEHVTPKATYPELVVALQNGDAVGITAEMPVAEGIVAANPDLTIVKFEDGKGFDVDTTVSIGLKNNTGILRSSRMCRRRWTRFPQTPGMNT